jgi:hypothetical protein
VATTVVSLRLAAGKPRQFRAAAGEAERVRLPRGWGPLLPAGPVSRSFDRTDLLGLVRYRSCRNTYERETQWLEQSVQILSRLKHLSSRREERFPCLAPSVGGHWPTTRT